MTLTLMPNGAPSSPWARVMPISAIFTVLYIDMPAIPKAAPDETCTMRP